MAEQPKKSSPTGRDLGNNLVAGILVIIIIAFGIFAIAGGFDTGDKASVAQDSPAQGDAGSSQKSGY